MKESDFNSSIATIPKLSAPAMVQETCFTDMFQSASPRHHQTAPSGLPSSYGYGFYPGSHSAQSSHLYHTDPYNYPLPPQSTGEQSLGQQSVAAGLVSGSPTSWATGAYNISPRAGSTGLDDWSMCPQGGPLTVGQSYSPYPRAFDSHIHGLSNNNVPYHGSSEHPTTHSPGIQIPPPSTLHHQPQSSFSPQDDHHLGQDHTATSSASTSSAGTSSAVRHPRQPYDWMKKQSYQQSAPSSGKTRTKDKYRIVYSEYQKVELEKEYLYSKYITIQRKAELSRSIGLSERQVKIWFQNRRAKERKQKRKREDVMSAQSTTDIPSPEANVAMKMEHHEAIKSELHHPDFSAHAHVHAQHAQMAH